jgi:hypothetical protein
VTNIAAIKEGILTVNKNWQLLFIQFITLALSGLSFFIIVGMPIAIAFILFGLDLTEILRLKDLVSVFRGSAELLNNYFAMALIILCSLLIYLSFILVLWVYALGGTIGILTKSVLNEISRFSLKTFFQEGKRFFFPLSMFSSIIGIVFLAIAFFLGILVGCASSLIDTAKSYEAVFGLFISFFLSLVLMSIGFALILLTLAAATFGIAHLAFNNSRSFTAIKETIKYLYSKPSAIGFYAVLLLGYIVIGFIAILIGAPLTFIPVVGPLISLPYQLLMYMFQGYLSLVMLSSIFHYYKGADYAAPRLSTEAADISQNTADKPAPPPEQMDGTQAS